MSARRQSSEPPERRREALVSDIESEPMARMDLRLSDEEKTAAQREADRQEVSLSAVMRQALAMYLGWLEGQRQHDGGNSGD